MKEQIIATCTQLFEQKGFRETSIQEIVEELGVTKGTFYYYFSSKEQVLMMIHTKYIDHLLLQQAEIMQNKQLTNKDKLRALIRMLFMNIIPNGDQARVFFREFRHLKDEHMKEVRAKRNQVRHAFENVLREGMDSGAFKNDLEPDIISLGILGACNWSYQWFQPGGKYLDTEIADMFINMIYTGIEQEANKGG